MSVLQHIIQCFPKVMQINSLCHLSATAMIEKIGSYLNELFSEVIIFVVIDVLYSFVLALLLNGLLLLVVFFTKGILPVNYEMVKIAGSLLCVIYLISISYSSLKYYFIFKRKHQAKITAQDH